MGEVEDGQCVWQFVGSFTGKVTSAGLAYRRIALAPGYTGSPPLAVVLKLERV